MCASEPSRSTATRSPTPAKRTAMGDLSTQSRGRYLDLRLLAGDRSLLSSALRVLHYRTQDTAGDPCQSSTISYRSLAGAYRCEKPSPMGKHQSTSFVITIANLDPVSLVWPQPVRLRFSTHLSRETPQCDLRTLLKVIAVPILAWLHMTING